MPCREYQVRDWRRCTATRHGPGEVRLRAQRQRAGIGPALAMRVDSILETGTLPELHGAFDATRMAAMEREQLLTRLVVRATPSCTLRSAHTPTHACAATEGDGREGCGTDCGHGRNSRRRRRGEPVGRAVRSHYSRHPPCICIRGQAHIPLTTATAGLRQSRAWSFYMACGPCEPRYPPQVHVQSCLRSCPLYIVLFRSLA